MRIISGTFRGRILADPTSRVTHPMSEKIRGALFNTLGDVEDLSMLDACAGTGSVAIEGISRGIKSAVAIDNDPDAFKCLTENAKKLHLAKELDIVCANVTTWSKNNARRLFNVVVIDPPFDQVNDDMLARISLHVASGGVYVASLPTDFVPKDIAGFTLAKSKTYGNAKLLFYKKTD